MSDSEDETDVVLDLSGKKINRILVPNDTDATTIIADKNLISKLEGLEKCRNLKQLSLAENNLVRMTGISKLTSLTVLNLPNNSIVYIEGLKDIKSLVWLNLAGNNLKTMENLSHNINIQHLDLSDNNITNLADISQLKVMRTLLLHGNAIKTLRHAPQFLPKSVVILSLAENEIMDINEVMYLASLQCLEQLSVMKNPCVMLREDSSAYDYRPFIINWVTSLKILDGSRVTEKESLKAEWLYSQGKGRHFKPGQHIETIDYLASTCPFTVSAEFESQEDVKLSRILNKQKIYQQELQSSTNSQLVSHPTDCSDTLEQTSEVFQQWQEQQLKLEQQQGSWNKVPPSHHPHAQLYEPHNPTSWYSQELNDLSGHIEKKSQQEGLNASDIENVSSKSTIKGLLQAWTGKTPEILGHSGQHGEESSDLHIQDLTTEEYERRSETSQLDSESVYLPLDNNSRPMTAPVVSAPSLPTTFHIQKQNNVVRPMTAIETPYEAYNNRPIKAKLACSVGVKGLTKPNFDYSPPCLSGNEPAIGAKKKTPPTAQAQDYDTSQDVSQVEDILTPVKDHVNKNKTTEEKVRRHSTSSSMGNKLGAETKSVKHISVIKSDGKTDNLSKSGIPVSAGSSLTRNYSEYAPGRYSNETSRKQVDRSTGVSSKQKIGGSDRRTRIPKDNSSYTCITNPSSSETRAAILIQSVWRGYWTRCQNPDAVSVRKEIRARRAEDHITLLRSELDRQKKMYEEEKQLRNLQLEAIRFLWKEVQSLQSWKNEVLTSQNFRTMDSSSNADSSYNYSQEIQNTLSRMDMFEGGRGTLPSQNSLGVDLDQHRKLEKKCVQLQNQVGDLTNKLQSVSNAVFQSGLFQSGADTSITGLADNNATLLVTGYEDDEISSCDESSFCGARWSSIPHSLSPYPSEEEESYFNSFPVLGCPTPPRNLRMEHKGEASVVLAWDPSYVYDENSKPINEPLLGYRVYIDDKSTSLIAGGGLKALVHGMNPKRTYKIFVKAVSSYGESHISNVIMAGISQTRKGRKVSSSSDTDNSVDEREMDSTESSDMSQHRKESFQRKRRMKSPRQDKQRTVRGKESSASDQEFGKDNITKSERPVSSRNNRNNEGIFLHPQIHTHSRSKTPTNSNHDQPVMLEQPPSPLQSPSQLRPKESHQSPTPGSQGNRTGLSASKLSETFTVDTQSSLLQAIAAAKSSLQAEKSPRTHSKRRSREINQDRNIEGSPGSDSKTSVSESKISNISLASETASPGRPETADQVRGHRRTRSKENLQHSVHEWKKEMDVGPHREVKHAWKKDSGGDIHGIPIIDGSKRSRPSSPAPSDVSDTTKRKTVADILEQKFSSRSGVFPEAVDPAALPPRIRSKQGSSEDVSVGSEGRRTPSKNSPPAYPEKRRSPSNGSESDISESSAARQLDMDNKSGASNTAVTKLLQKLQVFSKNQEDIRKDSKLKSRKQQSEATGIEEGIVARRQRQISGSESEPVQEKFSSAHHSENSSGNQSDDTQGSKHHHKTHRRTNSDHRVPVSPGAPFSVSFRSQGSPGSSESGPSTPSKTNVKRTASFHGVLSSRRSDAPRRSGSEENINEKGKNLSQSAGPTVMESMMGTERKRRSKSRSPSRGKHVPILSGAQLQKSKPCT